MGCMNVTESATRARGPSSAGRTANDTRTSVFPSHLAERLDAPPPLAQIDRRGPPLQPPPSLCNLAPHARERDPPHVVPHDHHPPPGSPGG
eukprot:1179132-Prorocentrum_minimum.AAC.1